MTRLMVYLNLLLNDVDASVLHCSCFCERMDGFKGISPGFVHCKTLCGGAGYHSPNLGLTMRSLELQTCDLSPPVLYLSPVVSCLFSVENPTEIISTVFLLCMWVWTLFVSIQCFCFVRDVTLSIGWFDDLTSALSFGPIWNTLEILGIIFRIRIWHLSKFLQARAEMSAVLNNKVVNSLKVIKNPCLELFIETKGKNFTALK